MPEDADLEQEAVDFMEDVQSDLERPEDITAERVEDLVMAGLSVVLPLFYLYTWTAARSLFVKLGQQGTVLSPLHVFIGTAWNVQIINSIIFTNLKLKYFPVTL